MWRRFFRAETGIFLALWLGLMLFGRSALLRDPGTFWHVEVGRKILDSGSVLRADPFSFTRGGQPWTAHQWLAECGMAAVHGISGFDGLLLVTATLLAAIYTWLASRMIRAGFHLLPVGVVLALVLLAGSHQFHVRPLILSIGLFGLTFAWLIDVDAGRRPLRWLWWMVPLNVLWANLHAGVLAGIGTLGLCAAWWCLAWVLGKGHTPVRCGRDAIELAALGLLSILAVLVNPYGLDLPRAWLATLTIPLPGLIEEHAPLDLRDPLGWTTVLLGLAYLVALMGVVPGRLRASWLVPLVWLVLACQRVRNVPLFAITAALGCVDLLPRSRWANWLKRHEMLLPAGDSQPAGPDARAAILPLIVVVVVAALQAAGVSAPVVGRGWARFDPARWPVGLLAELHRIDRESPEDAPTRIFNDLSLGGFVIHHAPRLRVFIDDRCALYGAEFLQAYERARRGDPAQLDRWQAEYGFRYALVERKANEKTPSFDRYLRNSARWTKIAESPAAVLFVVAFDHKAATVGRAWAANVRFFRPRWRNQRSRLCENGATNGRFMKTARPTVAAL